MEIDKLNPKQIKKIQETLLEMKKVASEDPVYFIDTFCYTFDPRLPNPHLRFKLFPFQKRLVRDICYAIDHQEDIFIEKCRDTGVTYTTLAVFLWYWLFVPGTNSLVGSRKEDFVDNRRGGTTGNKEESLFGKLDYMLSRLPAFMLPAGFNRDKHFTFMSLVNPENGNVISGESSNPNFSRGGRYRMILLDEFAFWDWGHQVWGSTADSTRCRIVVTTPGIKPSKAKRLRFGKDGEKIKVITIGYNLDPRKNRKWLEEERKKRSAEDFAREVLINWETSVTGRVYPEADSIQVGDYPFIPGQQLYCSWDFGLDGTGIVFAQINPRNGKVRIIDYFEATDKVIHWYFPLFGQPIDSKFQYTDDELRAIEEIKQYPPAIHFGDPDVRKRSYLVADTSTRQELAKIGIFVQSITPNEFRTRREVTKVWLQKGVELRQTPRTEYFLEAIKSARYPQREETSQATTPIALPVHDWTSTARTALEYLFLNLDKWQEPISEKPNWADVGKRWLTNRLKLVRGGDKYGL